MQSRLPPFPEQSKPRWTSVILEQKTECDGARQILGLWRDLHALEEMGALFRKAEEKSHDLCHLEEKRKGWGRKAVQKSRSLISILLMKKTRIREGKPMAQGQPAMFWVLRNEEGQSLDIVPSSLLWEGALWGFFLPASCFAFRTTEDAE